MGIREPSLGRADKATFKVRSLGGWILQMPVTLMQRGFYSGQQGHVGAQG